MKFVFVELNAVGDKIRKSPGYSGSICVTGSGGIVMFPAPVTGNKR